MSEKPFKLSATLLGHSLDVRSVVVAPDNSVISGSRDKTAKLWRPNGYNTGYTESNTYKDQSNFVAAVLYLEPSGDHPDGLIVTAGNDKCILVYQPNDSIAFKKYTEHTNVVCSLSKGLVTNSFVSGSWDTTVKFWQLKSPASLVTFSGHVAAVWCAIQLKDCNVVTASADRTIGIWTKDGQKVKSLTGHKDCVRALADFPELEQFISVANDAAVKVWSYEGQCLNTYYGHTNYIYCIARDVHGGVDSFVTGDEDRTVRYWADGVNTQVIQLPAQSVWSVACLSNGDVVTGTSDGVVRIFTQNESRFAEEEALRMYEEEVNALAQQSTKEIGGVKVTDLPGKEALYDPGKKAGQMKMIREPHGVVAYTWVEDGGDSHWEKVGDVLGGTDQSAEGKTTYQGKTYDYVFSVDVEDGKPPIKLPFNKGDDPYKAAHKFLSDNFLPAEYLDQVVNFILTNSKEPTPVSTGSDFVDPLTGGTRYMPTSSTNESSSMGVNLDPFTGGNSYTTASSLPRDSILAAASGAPMPPPSHTPTATPTNGYYPHTAYLRFDMGDVNLVRAKLREFRERAPPAAGVDEAALEGVVALCTDTCVDSGWIDVLFEMLTGWTDDLMFPVIDVVRLAVRNEVNSSLICTKNNGAIIEKLLGYLTPQSATNNMLVSIRALANLFLHSMGIELLNSYKMHILENITTLTTNNRNIQIGLSTVLLNMTILSLNTKDDVTCLVLASVLSDLVVNTDDSECHFRSLVAIGNLLTNVGVTDSERQQCRQKLQENDKFVQKLHHLLTLNGNDGEVKRRNCGQHLQNDLFGV